MTLSFVSLQADLQNNHEMDCYCNISLTAGTKNDNAECLYKVSSVISRQKKFE